MFAEGELVRLALAGGGALLLAGLLFFLAARLARAGRRRVAAAPRAVEGLDVSRLERVSRETAGEAVRLRFVYRGQRALLDFVAPRTTGSPCPRAARLRRAPGPESAAHAPPLLAHATTGERREERGHGGRGGGGPGARRRRRSWKALRRLHLGGARGGPDAEGLFLMKAGWLPAADLQAFVDGACALVGMGLGKGGLRSARTHAVESA